MRDIAERAKSLGPLLAVNSVALRGDREVPQELCNAILALALAFNDFRDLLIWSDDILKEAPDTARRLNRFFGEHGGVMTHLFRLLLASLYQLGEVIRANGKHFHNRFFQERVLGQLDKSVQGKWMELSDLAHGKAPQRPIGDLMEFVRHTAVYHYDSAELWNGFDRRFPTGSTVPAEQAVVSSGETALGERFYFADAAAYDLISEQSGVQGLPALGPKVTDLLTTVTVTLANVVEGFLEARGPLQPFAEEP
jgi:hypothetical protein